MNLLGIEMLIHFNGSLAPWPRMHFPACSEMFKELYENALIVPGEEDGTAFIAPRGRTYLDALEAVPLPTLKWVIEP